MSYDASQRPTKIWARDASGKCVRDNRTAMIRSENAWTPINPYIMCTHWFAGLCTFPFKTTAFHNRIKFKKERQL